MEPACQSSIEPDPTIYYYQTTITLTLLSLLNNYFSIVSLLDDQ